jgi:hypothetical protein
MNNPARMTGKSRLSVFLDIGASLELRDPFFASQARNHGIVSVMPKKSTIGILSLSGGVRYSGFGPASGRLSEFERVLYDSRGRADMHQQKAGGKLR